MLSKMLLNQIKTTTLNSRKKLLATLLMLTRLRLHNVSKISKISNRWMTGRGVTAPLLFLYERKIIWSTVHLAVLPVHYI